MKPYGYDLFSDGFKTGAMTDYVAFGCLLHEHTFILCNNIIIIIITIYLFTAIGLLPGGSGYFTCKQNMKLVTNKFKSGGLHEKHVVATWNVGNRLSICL